MNIMYMYGSKISATSLEIVPLPAVQTNKQYLVLENWKKKLQMSIKMAKSQRCVKNYSYYAKKKQKKQAKLKENCIYEDTDTANAVVPFKGSPGKAEKSTNFLRIRNIDLETIFCNIFFSFWLDLALSFRSGNPIPVWINAYCEKKAFPEALPEGCWRVCECRIYFYIEELIYKKKSKLYTEQNTLYTWRNLTGSGFCTLQTDVHEKHMYVCILFNVQSLTVQNQHILYTWLNKNYIHMKIMYIGRWNKKKHYHACKFEAHLESRYSRIVYIYMKKLEWKKTKKIGFMPLWTWFGWFVSLALSITNAGTVFLVHTSSGEKKQIKLENKKLDSLNRYQTFWEGRNKRIEIILTMFYLNRETVPPSHHLFLATPVNLDWCIFRTYFTFQISNLLLIITRLNNNN